jgi:predicted flap endonuclease-1-like 5' DNA nuclease
MKDVVARLIGYATVMLARILEKAFVEAAIVPPKVGLTLDTIIASIKAPLRKVLAALDNEKERDVVRAMYAEFQKTGKVRQTLPEDDRQIRRLHAIEVLKVPLSSLDASWPRDTGTAHGTGRPARATGRVKSVKAKPAPKEHKARIEPKAAAAEPHAAPRPAPKPQRVKPVAQAVEDAARTPMPQPAPAPQPVAQQPAASALPPGKLRHDSPVEQAPSIGPKTASRLEAIGIHTVEDLLAASPEDAANRLKFKHINARLIRDWQAQAALACSIPKLNSLAAQLMVAVGVRDTDDLANADPELLINMIDEFCETQDGQRILRDGNPPEEEQVKAWIDAAQEILTRSAA